MMKNLLFIDDSPANKISYYHILALFASLPFDMFYGYIILISFAAHTLLHVKYTDIKKLFAKQTLILQSVFWIALICILYTSYKNEGYNELGRRALMLWLPIVFNLSSFNFKKYEDKLLLGFSICCTLTVVYLFGDALHIIKFYNYPLSSLFTPAFINHNFSDPIAMHATFFSLQVAIALVYLLSHLMKAGTMPNKLLYGAACTILSAGLIQLGAKSVLATVVVVITFVLPFFILKGKKYYVLIILSITIIALTFLLLLRSETFKDRYLTSFANDMSWGKDTQTTDPRLARWKIAVEIIKVSPIIGHGTGAEVPLLKDAFYENRFYNSYLNGLNAHNEYLSFLIKSGALGLLAYLFTLAYGFKIALANRDVMFFTFMLLIAIVGLSENLLDVDKGIIYYGLFFCFFMGCDTASLNKTF